MSSWQGKYELFGYFVYSLFLFFFQLFAASNILYFLLSQTEVTIILCDLRAILEAEWKTSRLNSYYMHRSSADNVWNFNLYLKFQNKRVLWQPVKRKASSLFIGTLLNNMMLNNQENKMTSDIIFAKYILITYIDLSDAWTVCCALAGLCA